jgi:regulator of replication initiation timing
MSNLIKTIDYLRENPKRFIRISNTQSNTYLGKQDVYLQDIPNEDLSHYIKSNLGSITRPTFVQVELRFIDGATSRKKESFTVEILPETPAASHVPVQAVPTPMPTPAQSDFFTGALGQNSFGLGLPQIMEMGRKADRLADREEQLAELKSDHKDLKHENKLLDLENRELKTKLSTSEAQKDIAIQMVKLENKSFFESAAFEKMMENAPQLLSGFVAMKTGGVATGALGAGANMSETKNSLVEYIVDNIDDNQANFLGAVAGKLSDAGFMSELQTLIAKYANH